VVTRGAMVVATDNNATLRCIVVAFPFNGVPCRVFSGDKSSPIDVLSEV
jgi:hypothetical protein